MSADVGITAMLEVVNFDLGSTCCSEATLKSMDVPSKPAGVK